MKLYATIHSERESRLAKKGGDKFISINLVEGNALKYIILLKEGRLQVNKVKGSGSEIVFNG